MLRPHDKYQNGSPVSRWTALVCLLAYLAGGAGILPCLFLVIATKDGTHTSLVGVTRDQFKMVLQHRTPCDSGPAAGAPHQHGLGAKTLCLLSTQSPLDPDHRLELAQSSPTESTNVRTISPPLWEATSLSFPSLELSACQSAREPVWFPFDRGSPPNSGPLFSTACTVLVI